MDLIPVFRLIVGCHPSAFTREISSNLRGVPSGLLVSHLMAPLNPVALAINSASSLMLTSVPVPMFRNAASSFSGLYLQVSRQKTAALAKSST